MVNQRLNLSIEMKIRKKKETNLWLSTYFVPIFIGQWKPAQQTIAYRWRSMWMKTVISREIHTRTYPKICLKKRIAHHRKITKYAVYSCFCFAGLKSQIKSIETNEMRFTNSIWTLNIHFADYAFVYSIKYKVPLHYLDQGSIEIFWICFFFVIIRNIFFQVNKRCVIFKNLLKTSSKISSFRMHNICPSDIGAHC